MTAIPIERIPAAAEGASPPVPCADARVRELRVRVDSGDFDLLSLDVFDTLVWRCVPRPTDVFFLLADEVRERGGLFASSSRESFVRERVQAEERARRRTPSLEVTLADIWAEFPSGYLRGLAPAQVAEIELEVERRLVRVDPALRDLLQRARARGMKTALVSDTYFTSGQIRALTGVEADFTLVSCEHGLSKHRGLHRVLLEQSGVPALRVLHVGDNLAADIEGPAVFDVARFWFPKYPEAYEAMSGAELPDTLNRRSAYLATDDAGLTALRGRAMFAAGSEYERWGAGVLGPVVSGFCGWVAERCAELGITDVLCLMREGRILKQVLDAQASGLATRELFVSRYLALKAAILEGSEEELERFVFRPSPQKRSKLLRQLGLEASDLRLAAGDALLTPAETKALVRRIARDPALRRKVVRASATVRRNLLRHVAAALGPGGPRKVAIVDLGYRGTIQEAMQRVFDHEGTGLASHGLYLVTGGEVHVTQASGAVAEGWLAENGQPIAMAHTFMRSPEIVEQSLMADCGTTLGHDDRGEPVLDEFRIPDEQRRQIAEIQRGLLAWAHRWARHRSEHGIADTGALKAHYQAICVRAVARPLDIELELFGHWQHDENFGSASARTLVEVTDLHEWERAHLSAHQLASLPHARVYWPFGFAHGISRTMGEAVANIFLRTVPPEVFASAEPPRHLVFYWDSGEGFDAREARIEEYRLNNRGRLWHRFSLRMGDSRILRFGLTVGLEGEVLQLAGARVRRRAPDGREQTADFPHEALEKSGYRHLHGGLYVVEADPALLVIPAPGLDGFTGEVDVDVFFSVMC